MAGRNGGNHKKGSPPNPSLSPPPPSPPIPLHLCGFQTGDTVQVRGDTGELQFSVQFNLRRVERHSDESFNFLEANIPETGNFLDPVLSPPSSPYLTPTSSTGEFEHHDNNAEENSGCGEAPSSRGGVMTQLRSGALSPVKYYFGGIYGVSGGSLSSGKKIKSNKGNVIDEMLRRRSSPLRPCNSYAFFMMKNWSVVKRSSFVETSKKLSKEWSGLPRGAKKEYEDMASKDNARYKRQCLLLRNDVEQQITSCSS